MTGYRVNGINFSVLSDTIKRLQVIVRFSVSYISSYSSSKKLTANPCGINYIDFRLTNLLAIELYTTFGLILCSN